MKISKIHLYNFRGISDLELNLDKKSTILFGINGVGRFFFPNGKKHGRLSIYRSH